MSKRVIAAMSGGVDSAVSAALLVDAGYDVIGVTMRLGHHDSVEPNADRPSCCGVEGIIEARRVASQIGIPYYPVNYERLFARKVVDYFTQELKFGELLRLADELEADYVATGHYARVDRRSGRAVLFRGRDRTKDQSYVLFSLTQDQLARTLFPLGDMSKDEVRAFARARGLLNADKPESQEICFIGDDNYKRFLKERAPEAIQPGKIVTRDGDVLGAHAGTAFYTVGQRRGLGLAVGAPVYVTEIHAPDNTIVVGPPEELLSSECELRNVNWLSIPPPDEPIRARVKIRYKDPGADATVTPLPGGRVRLDFDVPRRAITPGQAAVFYSGELVLGGGWIV